MHNKVRKKSATSNLKEMKKLFGSAPVLTSERHNDYDAILKRLVECIQPDDIIEQMFVVDLANEIWEIQRYSSHKTNVIELEHHRHQEKENERRQKARKLKQAIAERAEEAKKAKEGAAEQAEPADEATAPTTQSECMLELEAVADSTVSDVDDILWGDADEIDHTKALQSGIDYFERLDRLYNIAIARRNDVLAQIEFYRQGLGQRLRRVSDEIIDAEFKETHQALAPSIAGPGDGAQ